MPRMWLFEAPRSIMVARSADRTEVFVLDTNVVSELRQRKTRRADPTMAAWVAGVAPR